jgi:hypothetical protein
MNLSSEDEASASLIVGGENLVLPGAEGLSIIFLGGLAD